MVHWYFRTSYSTWFDHLSPNVLRNVWIVFTKPIAALTLSIITRHNRILWELSRSLSSAHARKGL